MAYDNDNIFAKILRGEIPNDTVYEDDHVLAFRDINPARPVHVLVIPRGAYTDADDFVARAPDSEFVGFWKGVSAAARAAGVTGAGYRLIANTGPDGGQEVAHYHVHILGGAAVGPMVNRS
jgi:diadenosine tetraphosphate (Ap4A) HIT family hydrolase